MTETCAWGREIFPAEHVPPCRAPAEEPVGEDMLTAMYASLCQTHQRELRSLALKLRERP
jgi:hypothetical protein